MSVTEMQAGRELNAEIARRIFGAKTAIGPNDDHIWIVWAGISGVIPPSPYSTDMGAAWLVAKWMTEHGSSVTLDWGEDNDCWECSWITGGERYTAVSKHPALAICRAALAAVTS